METYSVRFPITVFWDITYKCNLRCLHCYCDAGNQQSKELSAEKFLAAIDYLAQNGVITLKLAGGEPLINPHWKTIITRAHQKGMKVSIATNGMLIDEPLAKEIAETGISNVQVSLDSMDPQVYQKIRGKEADFEIALKAIRYLRLAGVQTSVGVLINKYNADVLSELVNFVAEQKIRGISLFRLMRIGRGSAHESDLEVSEEQYLNILRAFKENRRAWQRRGMNFVTHDPFIAMALFGRENYLKSLQFAHMGCQAGRTILYIKPDGMITPCPFMDLPLGNIEEYDIHNIWAGHTGSYLRSNSTRTPENCVSCKLLKLCMGGCRGASYTASGGFGSPDPLCLAYPQLPDEIAKVLMEELEYACN